MYEVLEVNMFFYPYLPTCSRIIPRSPAAAVTYPTNRHMTGHPFVIVCLLKELYVVRAVPSEISIMMMYISKLGSCVKCASFLNVFLLFA